jgi:dipeptidyl aminopeptidase/acylaminoacyl peptidase
MTFTCPRRWFRSIPILASFWAGLAADEPKFEPMPARPATVAAIQAQQAAWTQELERTLVAFDSRYGSTIRMERAQFPAIDHRLGPAYIFTPLAMKPGRKYPGLVFIRESAHGQFRPSYFPIIEEAIRRGYIVICPDIRGSTGYGLAYYRDVDIAGKEVDDVLSATEFLVQHVPAVDPQRLAVMGISHGGMMALYALEKDPGRFRVGVDVVGPTSLAGYLARRVTAADRAEFFGQPSLAGAETNPAILVDKSPIAHVNRIRTPLLVMAVTNDVYTPVDLHPGPLVAALNAAKIAHEYHLYKDAPGGHGFFTGDSRLAENAQQDAFVFMDRALR